jgi:hypothetical protein
LSPREAAAASTCVAVCGAASAEAAGWGGAVSGAAGSIVGVSFVEATGSRSLTVPSKNPATNTLHKSTPSAKAPASIAAGLTQDGDVPASFIASLTISEGSGGGVAAAAPAGAFSKESRTDAPQ